MSRRLLAMAIALFVVFVGTAQAAPIPNPVETWIASAAWSEGGAYASYDSSEDDLDIYAAREITDSAGNITGYEDIADDPVPLSEFGTATLGSGSATVTATELPGSICRWDAEFTFPPECEFVNINVSVTWTATGSATHSTQKDFERGDGWVIKHIVRTRTRPAVGSMSVGAIAVGDWGEFSPDDTTEGQLSIVRSGTLTICRRDAPACPA